MFWRFGGYANISSIDTMLDKPDVTLEELLDEADLIQELKQHNSKLIEYLRDENVLRRLLEYVVAPSLLHPGDEEDEEEEPEPVKKKTFSPVRSLSMGRTKEQKEKSRRQEEREERDKADKARQKYAYIACEVLSSETWSILEALMENQQHLRKFWDFLKSEPPLDPVAASYFTKINETLLEKKLEETLEFIKTLDGMIPAIVKHVDSPMVMDLLLKIISMEKIEGGQGIVDWLQSQNLMPILLTYLGNEHPSFTQTAAGDFIKAIITISANASQNEQSCIGPNSLTRELVSETCIESLITNMLRGGNPLTVGVGIVIEVIRKNNSDYDPDVGAAQDSPPSSNDPIYLGTLLRLFAKHVPDFTELILSPNHTVTSGDSTVTIKRKELKVASGGSIEPLGFDRFKTCELMAELLHCSNMGLLNEKGSEAFVRQRDQERERLKAEGVLPPVREPQSAVTDFSEGSVTFHNGHSGGLDCRSPEEIRKQEIGNSAEDDGFEDVGASADLADDIKDDRHGDSPFELESNVVDAGSPRKPTRPRLDLDEEFFDEPLTSPRLEAIDEKETELLEQPESLDYPEANPISSASDLTATAHKPNINHDTNLTDFTSSMASEQALPDESSSVMSQPAPPQPSASDAPPLPHRDRCQSIDADTAEPSSPRGLSPHPDDKPPPLFADRSEPPSHGTGDTTHRPSEHGLASGSSQDTIDTTLGEEGDSTRSVLLGGNDPSFASQLENDVDGQPIVGDYLKMMFVEHQVVPTILDFFFRFPWNNFLHNVVYDVVQQVFNGPMDKGFNRSLAIDLFISGGITERIIKGQLQSDEAQAYNNMRLGYMGHLTLIAEEVVKFTERHTADVLSQEVLDKVSSKMWNDYVENSLSETRERDAAILGGIRPDIAIGSRQAVLNAVNAAHGFNHGSSSALANVGLNGGSTGLDSMDLANNSATSSGNFGLSGASLLSGFGSSSDEEDEEMEDVGEHDDGAEGTSDQYPTYAPSSLSALSIFSPPLGNLTSSTGGNTATSSADDPPLPPPLNIPPSRARRQFAARLAAHGKGTSPFTSPQPSPSDQDMNLSQLDPSATSSSLPLQFQNSTQTQEQKDVLEAAIEGNKSETPFGDLSEITGNIGAGDGLSVQALSEIYPDDFHPRDLDPEGVPAEAEGEEGHDVPITMALSPTPLRAPASITTAGPATQGTGEEGSVDTVGQAVSAKMSELFQHSESSSSGSSEEEENEEEAEEKEARGRGRFGVREARVRSALEDEDGE